MGQSPSRQGAPAATPRKRNALASDVARGAFQGDFARDLGLAGTLTQAALGYVPGVGTVCAARDAVASWRQRDRVGCALNALALVPFVGGVAKTAEALRNAQRISRALRGRRDGARQP